MPEKSPKEQIADLEKQIENLATARGDLGEAVKGELKLLEQELKIRETLEGKAIDEAERNALHNKVLLSSLEAQHTAIKEQIKLKIKIGDLDQATLDRYKEITVELDKQAKASKKHTDALEAGADAAKEMSGHAQILAQNFGIMANRASPTAKSIESMGKALKAAKKDSKNWQENLAKGAKSAAKSAASFFTISDFLGKIVDDSLAYAKIQRSVTTGMVQQGMATKDALKWQQRYRGGLLSSGVEATDLNNTVISFTQNNVKLTKTLDGQMEMFAKLGKVGFGAADSAEFLNARMFEFGETSKEALTDSLGDLAAVDKKLDRLRGTALKEFTTNLIRLNQYGPRSKQIFAELAVVSERTGLAMGKIIDVTKQFDTFEGAANLAQKLNVALGTSISSLELVGKTDVERAQIISKRLKESGKDLNNISPQLARVIENAGVDLGTLRRLAKGDLETVQQEAVKTSKDHTQVLQEAAAQSKDTLDPVEQISRKLTESFAGLADKINKVVTALANFTLGLSGTEILVGGGAVALVSSIASAAMTGMGLAGAYKGLKRFLGKKGGKVTAKVVSESAEAAVKGGTKLATGGAAKVTSAAAREAAEKTWKTQISKSAIAAAGAKEVAKTGKLASTMKLLKNLNPKKILVAGAAAGITALTAKAAEAAPASTAQGAAKPGFLSKLRAGASGLAAGAANKARAAIAGVGSIGDSVISRATNAASAAKKIGGDLMAKLTASGGGKIGGILTRMGIKGAGKAALKKLPFGIGLIFAIPMAIARFMEGDLFGGVMEVISGILAILPGIGTGASIATDVALLGRDVAYEVSGEDKLSVKNQLRDLAVVTAPATTGGSLALYAAASKLGIIPTEAANTGAMQAAQATSTTQTAQTAYGGQQSMVESKAGVYLDGRKMGDYYRQVAQQSRKDARIQTGRAGSTVPVGG